MENYPTLRKNVTIERCRAENLDLNGLWNVICYPEFRSILQSKLARHELRPPSIGSICGFAYTFPWSSLYMPYLRSCYVGRCKDLDWNAGWHSCCACWSHNNNDIMRTPWVSNWTRIEVLARNLRRLRPLEPIVPFLISHIITIFDLGRFPSSLLTIYIIGS